MHLLLSPVKHAIIVSVVDIPNKFSFMPFRFVNLDSLTSTSTRITQAQQNLRNIGETFKSIIFHSHWLQPEENEGFMRSTFSSSSVDIPSHSAIDYEHFWNGILHSQCYVLYLLSLIMKFLWSLYTTCFTYSPHF